MSQLDDARNNFIQGMSRIANFWGLPRAMGAIYGIIYLSNEPVPLNVLVKDAGITKGAVSTNIRILGRMGLIHKYIKVGDRKDYYTAEIDFWLIIKKIMKEREKNEFNHAIKSVGNSIQMLKSADVNDSDPAISSFYIERMKEMKGFFDTLDSLVSAFLAIESLSQGTIKKIFDRNRN